MLTRYARLWSVILAVAAGPSLLLTAGQASTAPQYGAAGRAAPGPSVSHAYQFLNQMMDQYAKGAVPPPGAEL